MGTFILVATTACTAPHQPAKTALAVMEKSAGKGGNPEVLNHCFGLKKVAKNLCFDSFFPNNSNLLIHPNHGEPVMLAGRGSRVEKRVLKLNNDDRILLYLDISSVKVPLSSNVKDSSFTYDQSTVVVNMNTTEIKENIVLKDKEGNIVLEYRVER